MDEEIPSPKEIISKGKIDIKVRRSGMSQFQEFSVKIERGPAGDYPILFIDKFVDLSELMRVAELYKMPVQAKNGRVFPKGKMAGDFAHLLK